jgi:four helix bundle protein
MKESILKSKSFEFALKTIELYKFLSLDQKEFVMSKQLLRPGTSIGANIREVKNAESKLDFIHKPSIAQKECDETMYWLELLHESGFKHRPICSHKQICHRTFANASQCNSYHKATPQEQTLTHNS